jgi:hypothetical protein
MQLSITDSKVVAGDFEYIITAPDNRHIFAINILDNFSQHFRIVTVKNSHLEYSDRFEAILDPELSMPKLKGMKFLSAFN